jgi:CheY-like chemotaxis protein
VTAHDGNAALNVAIESHRDVVVLDLGMPNLDGIAVIEGLRGWTTMPILVGSGRTGATDKVEALDAGADDYPLRTNAQKFPMPLPMTTTPMTRSSTAMTVALLCKSHLRSDSSGAAIRTDATR